MLTQNKLLRLHEEKHRLKRLKVNMVQHDDQQIQQNMIFLQVK